MKTILYLTDLYYVAKGRNYYEEDLFITSRLKDHFNILIGHPHQAIAYLDVADLIVFRNTGAVFYYQEYFSDFLSIVKEKKCLTFNSFDGKADIKGKQYLLDLYAEGYPVIPTVGNIAELGQLGEQEKYVLKIYKGADSIGMDFLTKDELIKENTQGKFIQAFIDFKYEVSFYYLNNSFQYALYAPNKSRRWELMEYEASSKDLEFADMFIKWNNMENGITRVDACRCIDDSLLLVELEDLNPFLSIGLLNEDKREAFMANFIEHLKVMTAIN